MPDRSTHERRSLVIRRRIASITRSGVLFALLIAASPILIPIAAAVDAVRWLIARRPAMTLRLLAFGFVFLAVDMIGLAWLFGSWIRSGFGRNRQRLVADAWPMQAWWARTLLATVGRLFRLELVVRNDEVVQPGPIVAMFRHASIIDNLLPAVLISHQKGIRLRWIVKRELLTMPLLDIAGNRLPNYFVDRASAEPRAELRRIKTLSDGMTERDGVLIYPEGTRYTPERFARAIDKMEEANDRMASRASRLRHVMPPRPGGTLTLLDSGADIVVAAHQGLEGFAKVRDVWSGSLIGKAVHVEFRRVPAGDIPKGRRERAEWLYDLWEDVDQWIDDRMGAG